MKEIKLVKELDATVEAPPSKAHTLRALFIAALANGKSVIKNPLIAEDQEYAIKALKKFGTSVETKDNLIEIIGTGGKPKLPDKDVFVGNSGVTMRFLATFAALAPEGKVILDGTERMRKGRPIQDLLDALKKIGVEAVSIKNNGCPPIEIKTGGIKGGITSLKGSKSSQYFSSLLISAPYAKGDVTIKILGEISSKPYIDVTINVMEEFGVEVENKNYEEFFVKSGQRYEAREYSVEGDFSNAAYFFAAAAVTGGRVRVVNVNPDSAQGDRFFVDCLDEMGCDIREGKNWIEVKGNKLKPIKRDMNDYPDIVQPLAVVAAFAEGKSEFTNIAHLRYKECDRLKAPVTELKKMGINAIDAEDSLIVEGGHQMHGAEIDTYNDHRMAMSFAIAGLKIPGIKIKNPEVVNKSFPEFWGRLESLYGG